MSREAPTEVELLEMCEYFEKVLRNGSRSSVASAIDLLSRDNCPYTPILKAKGIIQTAALQIMVKQGLNELFLCL